MHKDQSKEFTFGWKQWYVKKVEVQMLHWYKVLVLMDGWYGKISRQGSFSSNYV